MFDVVKRCTVGNRGIGHLRLLYAILDDDLRTVCFFSGTPIQTPLTGYIADIPSWRDRHCADFVRLLKNPSNTLSVHALTMTCSVIPGLLILAFPSMYEHLGSQWATSVSTAGCWFNQIKLMRYSAIGFPGSRSHTSSIHLPSLR